MYILLIMYVVGGYELIYYNKFATEKEFQALMATASNNKYPRSIALVFRYTFFFVHVSLFGHFLGLDTL